MFHLVMVVRPRHRFSLDALARRFDSWDAACDYAARITASSGGYFAVEMSDWLDD